MPVAVTPQLNQRHCVVFHSAGKLCSHNIPVFDATSFFGRRPLPLGWPIPSF